jgi:TPR repeat protein
MGLNFNDTLKKAECGDIEAQYALATAYYEGDGVEEDYAQAANWFRKAAESGCAESAYWLGMMYGHGRGLKEDVSESAKWYDKALILGINDPSAIASEANCIADAFHFGKKGASRNYPEALRWYRLAVEGGLASAACMLGNMYAAGEGVPKDEVEAARWYHKSVEMDPYEWDAKYKLGLIYRDGIGVSKDSEKAWDWLDQAARKGHRDAQYALGMMQLAGDAPDLDGADWFETAAERGHVLAQLAAGEEAENRGRFASAYAWYALAISNGNASARAKIDLLIPKMSMAAMLAGKTHHAALLARDAKAKLLEASRSLAETQREHAYALEEEGDCYFYGRGVPKDYHTAFVCYREAVRHGSSTALYHAGLCCLNREEPYRDEIEAYAYWSLASTSHNSSVRGELAKLEERISHDDRVRGQEIANMIRADIEANKLGG